MTQSYEYNELQFYSTVNKLHNLEFNHLSNPLGLVFTIV